MTAKKKQPFDFEKSLQELTRIVEEMESSEGSLEASLENFERGVTLIRECQQTLKAAEQKVEILLQKNGTSSLTPYEPNDDQ